MDLKQQTNGEQEVKLIFVRHANARKGGVRQHDSTRRLSTKGVRQAKSIRSQLRKEFGKDWKPGVVFMSNRIRVQQTIELIVGHQGIEHQATTHILPALMTHPKDTAQKRIERMFNKLTYSALRKYRKKYNGAQEIFTLAQLVKVQMSEIVELFGSVNGVNNIKTVMVGGHAVLLPAIMYQASWARHLEKLLDYNMPECGVMIFDTDTGTLEFLEPNHG